MDRSPYSTRFVSVPALDGAIKTRMASLYLASYDASSEALFLHDLDNKDEALLLYAGSELVGFTTLLVFEREWGGQPIRLVYSGDTVVDRPHWGQRALAFAWIARMGALKRASVNVPLYWFLLVKGHRTFRFLPVFGKSFYPHWSVDRSDLKPLADELATDMFHDDYNPRTGVVEFNRSQGQLKPCLALPSPEELDREGVRFFLERNPGFRRGHELVCVCEIEEHNMKPMTLRLFRKAALGSPP
ncbi:MAG TPA: hypothetical protein VI485_13680 [Vicinamibacterales bacterium]|nr:hypothetical protein [Vicinamibacterales bacterium]